VLRRDGTQAAEQPSVVAGPLCESGDVFTQGDGGVVLPRDLPGAQVGDLLVIHDTGAYGASMSSNYNTRPLIAEVLVDGGQARLIRRRQTVDELLALETGL
jgi:diaminopimelate decarboxylase